MNTPVHIDDAEFESSVLKSEIPVLVDFWAPWCGPCKMVAPILEKLATEYSGKVTIAKVNTDENPRWATEYGVQGIPTLLFIRDGKVEDRIVGVAPAPVIKTKIDALLNTPVKALRLEQGDSLKEGALAPSLASLSSEAACPLPRATGRQRHLRPLPSLGPESPSLCGCNSHAIGNTRYGNLRRSRRIYP